MDYIIRPCVLADAETLGKIHAQAWHESYEKNLMPEDTLLTSGPDIARAICRLPNMTAVPEQGGYFLVESSDKRIVGFGECGAARKIAEFAPGEIYHMYLLQEAQQQGLGRKLLFTLLDYLGRSGMEKAGIKIHADFGPARQFYERCGGQYAGERVTQSGNRTFAEAVYVWNEISRLLDKAS